MKSKEVREFNIDQLKQQLISKEEELFNLKIQLSTKQLDPGSPPQCGAFEDDSSRKRKRHEGLKGALDVS
jgi:hypothetical protein